MPFDKYLDFNYLAYRIGARCPFLIHKMFIYGQRDSIAGRIKNAL